ncbi:MAG: hypothetical protein F082_1131 [bacterium F082]|nr:MAG: hypothetical protein F082_1131 [bacterium F082]KWW28626.1 MAG: hypothetical protein AUK64_1602 [bacterium P201]
MFKLKQMILMLCFVLSGALCHANNVTETQNEKDGHQVSIELYDLQGKETQKVLDLRDLASGVYTYTVFCGKYSQNGKLVIVK